MKTVRRRFHPDLVEEIDRLHERMSLKFGRVSKSSASKVLAEQLKSMNFVDSIEFVNVREKKQKRKNTLCDVRVFR